MDIHKARPFHGWRELLKEVGIIVVGVLIALGAEQAVAGLHERRVAQEARESIRAEVAVSLGRMAVRAGTEACVTRRLDEAAALIATPGPAARQVVWIGHPLHWPVVDSQYRAASQAGRVSLLPPAEQADYATIYAELQEYGQAEADEQKAWSDLRVLEDRPTITPIVEWQVRSALKQARTARWSMEAASRRTGQETVRLGIQARGQVPFTMTSVCLPIDTPRPEALKQIIAGRGGGPGYDEP